MPPANRAPTLTSDLHHLTSGDLHKSAGLESMAYANQTPGIRSLDVVNCIQLLTYGL